MTSADWPEFLSLIQTADVASMGPGRERPSRVVGMIFGLLSKYTIEQVREAIASHLAASDFMVKPASIVRYIDGEISERSLAAWEVFIRAIELLGGDDSVRFPDPAFHYAIEMLGGWERLAHIYGQLDEAKLEFRKIDWRKFYELGLRKASWCDEPGRVKVPPYLMGFFERDNREKGFPEAIPDVLLVNSGRYVSREEIGAPILPLLKPLMLFGGGTEPQRVGKLLENNFVGILRRSD